MLYFREMLVLLWCAACIKATCSNVTICVASENAREAECPQSQHVLIVKKLSDLTANETSCQNVYIYLTSGTHILNENLDFSDSVEGIEIHGASLGQPSSIECENSAGIRFSENRGANKVLISNVFLLYSHRTRNAVARRAALYFKNARYTLNSVTVADTVGWGLYADQCSEQIIFNCTFANNIGNIRLILRDHTSVVILVNINKTKIHDGKVSDILGVAHGGIDMYTSGDVGHHFSIVDCDFQRNQGSHLLVISNHDRSNLIKIVILIENSNFTINNDIGVRIESLGAQSNVWVIFQRNNINHSEMSGLYLHNIAQAEITSCVFTNNSEGVRVSLDSRVHGQFTSTGHYYNMRDSLVQNNSKAGILLQHRNYPTRFITIRVWIEISKIDFFSNSRALSIQLWTNMYHHTNISECTFTNHRTTEVIRVDDQKMGAANTQVSTILEKSFFRGNQGLGSNHDCSILYVRNAYRFTLKDVNITDNNCTGITLLSSMAEMHNFVNVLRNRGLQGGAFSLSKSVIIFTNSSKLHIINNTADTYGGGIYSDKICTSDSTGQCFFRFKTNSTGSEMLVFAGNRAERGGDVVFGGCLSKCLMNVVKGAWKPISKCHAEDKFWDLVSSRHTVSQSTFVEYKRRVAFCTNTTILRGSVHGATCQDSHSINVYRGQMFTVPLMVTDECCFPSAEPIEAKVNPALGKGILPLQFKHDTIQRARKYCHNYAYTLVGGLEQKTATIAFSIQQQYFSSIPPVTLTVCLNKCPTGYEIDSESGECGCLDILKSHGIECNPSNLSLTVPAHTWVGELGQMSGSVAVQSDCQYCYNEGRRTVTNITGDSDKLCITNRTGIMCGACVEGYSLQLGGYECADCSNSTHKGVLLLIAFTIIGIALVLLLLGLNLTVSTGMINGLIFYCNIVYLNHDTMLPITRDGKDTHLQNTVRILSTFQAWMNLDFGITTCFFDGYNTYISTWMQFVFPLYMWLLILVIVLSSRYSKRVSKITASHTVSVLVTLLLLSYAKIMKTSIEVFSVVQLQLLDRTAAHRAWKPDANIPYLGPSHVPLFLMSLAMVMTYATPFTLLILLGPILQAKSHYRILNWINKLKPLLDAFYGPYTSRYRYWPGILLLARLLILCTYSRSNTPFKLLTVSAVVAVLLVTWNILGKTRAVSFHQKTYLKYLELFFLLNLGIFVIASVYTTQFSQDDTTNQQGLAVAMVGSVLAVFSVILGYHTYCTLTRYKATSKIVQCVPARIKAVCKNKPLETSGISTETTYSVVEMTEMSECATHNNLRESLLTTKDC